MSTIRNRVLIAIIVLVLFMMACVGGGGGSGSGSNNTLLAGPDATAAYGAQQLKIQLTAVARP